MSWTSPPDKVTECRDGMILCAGAATLGCSTSGFYHYPEAGLKTTALPFCILTEGEDYQAERHAPGESYGVGSVRGTFYLDPATTTIGQAEQACRELVHQLAELQGDNLFITSATRSLASRVRRSKIAATNDGAARSYFTIQVTVSWQG